MKQRFGSIAGYFSQGLRIETGGQRALRAALMNPDNEVIVPVAALGFVEVRVQKHHGPSGLGTSTRNVAIASGDGACNLRQALQHRQVRSSPAIMATVRYAWPVEATRQNRRI